MCVQTTVLHQATVTNSFNNLFQCCRQSENNYAMEKIKEYMDRTLTLKDLFRWMAGVAASLALLVVTWLKTHEDKQDQTMANIKESQAHIIKSQASHEIRITANEDFKKDVKLFQIKQEENHIETLKAIGGLNTNIDVLVERVSHLKQAR